MKKKIQIVKITVPASGNSVKIDTQTEITHSKVDGVFITISDYAGYKKSTIDLRVDEEEIIPEDFEVALLMPTSANSIKDVVFDVKEKAKGSNIRGTYVDGGEADAYPYDVRVYFTTEKE